jgi:DNA-binding MarR family transcriptional regulator
MNIVGVFVLSVASDIERTTECPSILAGSGMAAVMIIAQQPGLSIDQLRRILRLSHSGCVRLVDRLVVLRLVSGEAGSDGRTVSLKAAQPGLNEAARISSSRLSLLRDRLNLLSADELGQLGRIAAKLLTRPASTAYRVAAHLPLLRSLGVLPSWAMSRRHWPGACRDTTVQ